MRAIVADRRLEAIAGVPLQVTTTWSSITRPAGTVVLAVGIQPDTDGRENLIHCSNFPDTVELQWPSGSYGHLLGLGGAVVLKDSGPAVAGWLKNPVDGPIGLGGLCYTSTNFHWTNPFACAVYDHDINDRQASNILHWLAQRYQIPM